jgi:thioredoxin reductase (NADPH)
MGTAKHADEVAFPTLDADDLEHLQALATCQQFDAGEIVLRAGDSDIDLIVVESGFLEIRNPADKDRLIVTHGPGMFAGDIDLLTRRPIIVNMIAAGDGHGGPTRVLRIPNAKLRHVLNAVPRLSEKLITAFQARRTALAKAGVAGVRVLGPVGCGHTNRIREFLYKNFVPFTWVDSGTTAGRATLKQLGPDRLEPVVDCGPGRILNRPSLQEVARCAGVWRGCPSKDVDFAIVGGGPAGISAAVYAASEGLKTVVLDQLGPGGQASGSSKIENFIGFPAGLSGMELATRGVLQMLKFGAAMIAPVTVTRLEPATDEQSPHHLHLDCGTVISARTVLAATGVRWRRLQAEGAERFERTGVYYACTAVEARLYDDHDVAVVGGGNSAGQAVMFLAESCRQRTVHLMIRRDLEAGMSDYLVSRIRSTANVKVHEGTLVSAVRGEREMETIELTPTAGGEPTTMPCASVFVFIGAEPHADWLPESVARDRAGYVLTGTDVMKAGLWPLTDRDPCPLETSIPRLLAGGDLRWGSTKRVGFAVGDGSLAVTCVHKLRAPAVEPAPRAMASTSTG